MEHKFSNELPPVAGQDQGEANPAESGQNNLSHAEQASAQAIEAGISTPSQSGPAPVAPQTAQAGMPQTSRAQTQIAAGLAGMPAIADDADLIEKEWVLKAKEIVARTSNDPYEQNREVEKMKADYMKKRYNKDVKVTEN